MLLLLLGLARSFEELGYVARNGRVDLLLGLWVERVLVDAHDVFELGLQADLVSCYHGSLPHLVFHFQVVILLLVILYIDLDLFDHS